MSPLRQEGAEKIPTGAPNGLELSCPAEAGYSSPLYAELAGRARRPGSAARRVSFSELLGGENGRTGTSRTNT